MQTITLTPTGTPLALNPVWRSSPFLLAGTVGATELATWKAQLWRRPQDAGVSGAEPLATAYGSTSGGTVNLAFTSLQMSMALAAGGGAYDDIWLVVGGRAADSQVAVSRGDWLRVMEGGFDPANTAGTPVLFTVTDDVANFVYDGVAYALPVVAITTPAGAEEGQILVLDDTMIFTQGGVSFAAAVTALASLPLPGPTDDPRHEYVTGSDGATYLKATLSDGNVYYTPVFTTAP